MKVFLDTNILIDFVCKRNGFYEEAKKIFALGYLGRIEIGTSALSIVNSMYVGKKYGLPLVKERIKSALDFLTVNDFVKIYYEYGLGRHIGLPLQVDAPQASKTVQSFKDIYAAV